MAPSFHQFSSWSTTARPCQLQQVFATAGSEDEGDEPAAGATRARTAGTNTMSAGKPRNTCNKGCVQLQLGHACPQSLVVRT